MNFSKFSLILFLLLVFVFGNGCAVVSAYRANSLLASGDCGEAIDKYEDVLNSADSNNNKYVIFSANHNLGIAYDCVGDDKKAVDHYLKSINAIPERGYYSYISLALLFYKKNELEQAYYYSQKAEILVSQPAYYDLERWSVYNANIVKNLAISVNGFIKLRLNFYKMSKLYASGDIGAATAIASNIINTNYCPYIGIGVSGNSILSVDYGSIADINGLLKGDKIIRIDGKTIDSSSNEAWNTLGKYFDKYGTTMHIVVSRKCYDAEKGEVTREIPIECKLIYPEIEQTRNLLATMKAQKSGKAGTHIAKGPWLKVIEPKSARRISITASNKVDFQILGADVDYLKSVTVNGVQCSAYEADTLERTMLPGKVRKYAVSLPIANGENSFKIVATNLKGHQLTQKLTVSGKNEPKIVVNNLYDHRVAVVIGINRYYPWPSLEYAVNDAKSIKDQLLKMGFDKVIELYDRDATKGRMLRILMDDLPTQVGPNDCLLVFFSGHGATEVLANGAMEGYIIPVDSDVKNFSGTAISMSSIHEMIKRCKAKHTLLVFDSCYSGYGLKRSKGGQTKPRILDGYIKSMAQKRVSYILTAGGKDEEASEERGHGVFTRVLLDSLIAASSLDEYLLASDIAQHVRKTVHDKSGGKQVPQYGPLDEGEGDFIFEKF